MAVPDADSVVNAPVDALDAPTAVPSIVPALMSAVGIVAVPVNVGLASGALVAILFVTVVEKFTSFPRAVASSRKVLSAAGELSTRFETAVSV